MEPFRVNRRWCVLFCLTLSAVAGRNRANFEGIEVFVRIAGAVKDAFIIGWSAVQFCWILLLLGVVGLLFLIGGAASLVGFLSLCYGGFLVVSEIAQIFGGGFFSWIGAVIVSLWLFPIVFIVAPLYFYTAHPAIINCLWFIPLATGVVAYITFGIGCAIKEKLDKHVSAINVGSETRNG